jgi:hypothetical protein
MEQMSRYAVHRQRVEDAETNLSTCCFSAVNFLPERTQLN